ncbi:MAG: VWA-like domain-containing protein, partial [Promethearchaeota archaeon]
DNGFGISRFDSHFEEGNKAEGDKKKKDWDQILSEAAAMAKERGDVPAGVGRYIEAKLYSKLDWKALLQKYITREIPTDTTWSRPNKKSLATGGYLPDVVKEKVDVVVSFDLSGSINDDLAGEFLSECIGLSKSFESIRMTLLVHDAEVQQVIPVRNGNIKKLRKLKMKGGGGTDHRPVYEWIKKNKPNTKVLINFTDGYTAFPDKEPEFKSLWVLSPYSCSESEIEFGETVKMKEQ